MVKDTDGYTGRPAPGASTFNQRLTVTTGEETATGSTALAVPSWVVACLNDTGSVGVNRTTETTFTDVPIHTTG